MYSTGKYRAYIWLGTAAKVEDVAHVSIIY